MLCLSYYKYHQGPSVDWIKYAGEVSRLLPVTCQSEPTALHSHESPAPTYGQVSDPALDGCAVTTREH